MRRLNLVPCGKVLDEDDVAMTDGKLIDAGKGRAAVGVGAIFGRARADPA